MASAANCVRATTEDSTLGLAYQRQQMSTGKQALINQDSSATVVAA